MHPRRSESVDKWGRHSEDVVALLVHIDAIEGDGVALLHSRCETTRSRGSGGDSLRTLLHSRCETTRGSGLEGTLLHIRCETDTGQAE